jgi:NADH:ubiquinone oxidoreductase subunit H
LPRVAYPRYRYDQLIKLGWKKLLPLSFSFFIFYLGLFKFFSIFPI